MKFIIDKIKEHLGWYSQVYVCVGIFMFTIIIIGLLATYFIFNVKPQRADTQSVPLEVKVFINDNDTIMPKILDNISELKSAIDSMRQDSLQLTIVRGR